MGLREKALKYSESSGRETVLDRTPDPSSQETLSPEQQEAAQGSNAESGHGLLYKAELLRQENRSRPGHGLLSRAEKMRREEPKPSERKFGLLNRAKKFLQQEQLDEIARPHKKGLLSKAEDFRRSGHVPGAGSVSERSQAARHKAEQSAEKAAKPPEAEGHGLGLRGRLLDTDTAEHPAGHPAGHLAGHLAGGIAGGIVGGIVGGRAESDGPVIAGHGPIDAGPSDTGAGGAASAGEKDVIDAIFEEELAAEAKTDDDPFAGEEPGSDFQFDPDADTSLEEDIFETAGAPLETQGGFPPVDDELETVPVEGEPESEAESGEPAALGLDVEDLGVDDFDPIFDGDEELSEAQPETEPELEASTESETETEDKDETDAAALGDTEVETEAAEAEGHPEDDLIELPDLDELGALDEDFDLPLEEEAAPPNLEPFPEEDPAGLEGENSAADELGFADGDVPEAELEPEPAAFELADELARTEEAGPGEEESESGDGVDYGLEPVESEQVLEEIRKEQEKWEEEAAATGSLPAPGSPPPLIEFFDEEEDFETIPTEFSTASQRKVDNYLALIELSKELHNFEYTDDLWVELLYNLMSQFGTGRIAIFAPDDDLLESLELVLVSFKGIKGEVLRKAKDLRIQSGDNLFQVLLKEKRIFYTKDFPRGALSRDTASFLQEGEFELVAPIATQNNVYGLMLLGKKTGEQFHPDDLEYLSLLGELFATAYLHLLQNRDVLEANKKVEKQKEMSELIFKLAGQMNQSSDLDALYDNLKEVLQTNFSIEGFSMAVLSNDQEFYRLFAGNVVNPPSMERFRMPVHAAVISGIKERTDLYEVPDFRNVREIVDNYSGEDLSIFTEYLMVPFISAGWLVGFLNIYKRSETWDEIEREKLLQLADIMAPNIANALIVSSGNRFLSEEFQPLIQRIDSEIRLARRNHARVSVARVQLANRKRVRNLVHPKGYERFNGHLNRILRADLGPDDHCEEHADGVFILIFRGKDHAAAERTLSSKRAEILKVPIRESLILPRVSYQIYTFPDDGDDPDLYRGLMNIV